MYRSWHLILLLKINLWSQSGLGDLIAFHYVTHHQRYIDIDSDLNNPDLLDLLICLLYVVRFLVQVIFYIEMRTSVLYN